MSLFDDALAEQGVSPKDVPFVQPSGVYFKDADTFVTPDGKTVRLQNGNAYETQKTGRTADSFTPAQTGADEQLQLARRIALEKGFNKPVLTGKKDPYSREIGDLVNADGEYFSQYMVNNRLIDPYMEGPDVKSQMNISDLDRARDQSKGIDSVADKYLAALNVVRHQDPLTAKLYANTSKVYGASLDKRGNSDVYTAGAIQHADEDYKGDARSNLSTGWESGMDQMKQGAWNALDILGDITGHKAFSDTAQAKSRAYRDDLSNLPNLRNGEAFDDNGDWKLDTFSKMADFAIGNAAASAPQMMLSIASAAATPLTFGASNAIPAVIFAGQTWENQKEKNAKWAIASGVTQQVLESFGINKLTGSIFHKATQEQVIKQLVKKGYTEAAAKEAIVASANDALKGVADFAKREAIKDAESAVARANLRSIPKAVGGGILSETPTEAGQEITQYFGEQSGFKLPDNDYDRQQLKNRVANAAAGGFVLGGTFGGGATASGNILTRADGKAPTSDMILRQKIMEKYGEIPLAENMGKDALKELNDDHISLSALAADHNTNKANRGMMGGVADWFSQAGVHSLWDKFSNTLKGKDTEGDNVNALWSLLGSSRAFGGGSIEEQQRHINNELQKTFGSPDEVRKAFGGKSITEVSSILSRTEVKSTIESLINVMNGYRISAAEAAQKLNMSGKLGTFLQHQDGIIHYAQKLDHLISTHNQITGQKLTTKEFMNMQPINRNAIQRNPSEFISLLVKHLGVTKKEAEEATSRLMGDQDMQTIDDPFDAVYNSDPKSVDLKNNLNAVINSNPAVFAKFINSNPIENAYALAARGAAAFVNKNLIGSDGNHLAALLNNGVKNGEISPERASYVASQLKDWLDMRKGKYHEVSNKYVKGALATVNFLSTVSSLPLAAVSSTVEFAQIYRNLNTQQSLKATMALLKGTGAEIMNAIQSIGGHSKSKFVADYRDKLFNYGFSAEGDIGRRNDIVTGYYQKWTEGFFKMTGLTSVTNITRYAKLAIGRDAIGHWLDLAQNAPESEEGKAAREHLVRIGIDVDWIFSIDREAPENQQRIEREFNAGMHNFTTEAVVHPTKMNRPKFYNDPYLQLFTQFQGYTSAFTANILPRLLKDLRANGTKEQVNAAATIAMMFALAYFAMFAKDIIKYGESPPQWLKDEKKFQRYIGQVGLLGSGQRIWDAVSSVLPDGTQRSVLSTAYKNISDQAPALAYINKVDDALSAPPSSQIKKSTRLLPVFGTAPQFADYMQKQLGVHE